MDEDEIDIVPVVREDMPDGPAVALDGKGNTIGSEKWAHIRCVGCDDQARVPIESAQAFRAGPDGVYVGMCGECTVGRKVTADDDVGNRAMRREAKKRKRRR